MKMHHRWLSLLFFSFLPLALLSGCDGPANNGLLNSTRIHTVGSKAKMNSLLKEAEAESTKSYGGIGFFDSDNGPVAEDSGSGSRDYVDTNEQVAGVKEGDIVKTDGYDIFYAPRYHNVIRVVSVEDNYDVTLARTIELGSTYVESLYLLDKYLVVIGYTFEEELGYGDEEAMYYRWWSPTGTVIVIDRTTFEIAYRLITDSFFMDHRVIDNSVFLVSHKYLYLGDVEYEYRPIYKETREGVTYIEYLGYDSMYYFDDSPVYGMNVLTGIKITDDAEDIFYTSDAYLGASSSYKKMYVNATDMYLIESVYHYEDNSYWTSSVISQFALDVDSASSAYVAAGIVLGISLNQFSVGVYDGYLRVATTERKASWTIMEFFGWTSESTITNHLFILRVVEESEAFELIGHLSEGLGKPNEEIKSVRFEGETAYIVTFLLTDPLYIIDLSDPSNPVIDGQIEQEGFDTYQHEWGEGNLIGIGYNADQFGSVTGMKISAYNVAQDEEETIQTYEIFSYGYTDDASWSYGYSEALYNHKALLLSVSKGYLGFAVEAVEYGYEDGVSERDWYYRYHSYYYLFKIDFSEENPIADPIIIEHPTSDDYYLGVDRGVMIDDYVYTLSDYGVITYSLSGGAVVDPPLSFNQ
ncbi:MAG: beta-propeller domain-containing protein [Bacilli bacterium]|nr:beta-propeller domain-containing protein [Bacilli bacterium]